MIKKKGFEPECFVLFCLFICAKHPRNIKLIFCDILVHNQKQKIEKNKVVTLF